MEWIFNYCVTVLFELAKLTHLSYQEINVLIFCIIWPVVTLYLFNLVKRQKARIKALESKLCIVSSKLNPQPHESKAKDPHGNHL